MRETDPARRIPFRSRGRRGLLGLAVLVFASPFAAAAGASPPAGDGVLGADGDHDLFGGRRGTQRAVALRDLFPEVPFPHEIETRVRQDGRRGFTGAA